MQTLSKEDICFEKRPDGVVSCTLKTGARYENVHCVELFPMSLPRQFISIFVENEQEISEIGVIIDIDLFDEEQRKILCDSIYEYYFVPEIKDIRKIATKQSKRGSGFCELEVDTDRGRKNIYLFNTRESININSNGVIIITDIDRNRFKICAIDKLPEKARHILDSIML